jgi:RNA polymerase sigma-70 factor (ECF subfamily)
VTDTPARSASTVTKYGPVAEREGALSRSDFETFVREYSNRLQAVARRLLRSEHDAADALQDAYLSAFRSRHRFCGNSTVYTWLYRIVVNTCLMKIRARTQPSTVSLSDLSTSHGYDECCPDVIAIAAGTASAEIEAQETHTALRCCIDRLSDSCRTVLTLRCIEGFSTDETASLLNLSRSVVKTRLHRARAALRILLDDGGAC